MRSQQDACGFAPHPAGPVLLQSCLQQQEIEELRFEKQQLTNDNNKLSTFSKQHKGLSAALLCKLLKQQSSTCSSISGLSNALAQQCLLNATLHKALALQHAQTQQQQVFWTSQLAAKDYDIAARGKDIALLQAAKLGLQQQQDVETATLRAQVAAANTKAAELQAACLDAEAQLTCNKVQHKQQVEEMFALRVQVTAANNRAAELQAACLAALTQQKEQGVQMFTLRAQVAASNTKAAELQAACLAFEAQHKAQVSELTESLLRQKHDSSKAMAALRNQNVELLLEVSRARVEKQQLQQNMQQLTVQLQQQQQQQGGGQGLNGIIQQHRLQQLQRAQSELQKHALSGQALRVLAHCHIDSTSIHNTAIDIICRAAALPNMSVANLKAIHRRLTLLVHSDKAGSDGMFIALSNVVEAFEKAGKLEAQWPAAAGQQAI